MEPRIQYAKTSDGVNIAYAIAGEGRPLLSMVPPGFSHVEREWEMFAATWQPLLASYRVVIYDTRGSGMSDRHAIDHSMDTMLLDLNAVIERSELDSFVLVAVASGTPLAITYAAAHPQKLTHLILVDGWAQFSDFAQSPAYRAGLPLLETDWMLFTETFGQVLWFHADPDFGRRYADFLRACSGPEAMRAIWKWWETHDVTELLPSLTVPTLVIQNKNNRWVSVDVGQRLAAAIPNARLTLIDDLMYTAVPDLVDAFVKEDAPLEPKLPSGMTAILFADIVDSTVLTERLGDAAFREKARELGGALRALIRESSGTSVEGPTLGDGVLAVFTSAREAIEAARRCGKAGDDAGLPLHLGIHAGDVTREKDPDGRDNVYGGAVNIAARISGLSAQGEVLVSETVRSLARTSAGVGFEDRGEQALKGVGEAVRVWAVVQEGSA